MARPPQGQRRPLRQRAHDAGVLGSARRKALRADDRVRHSARGERATKHLLLPLRERRRTGRASDPAVHSACRPEHQRYALRWPDSHFPPLFPPDAQGKIALIAGPHGAMDLLNIVKNIAWDLWVSEFGVDESKRPPVRIRYQRHDGRQLVPDALRSRAKSRIACEQRSAGHHVRNPSADLPDHPLLAYANSARAATNAADASTLPAMMAHAAGRAQLTVQPTPKRSGRNRLASSGLQ